MLIMKWIYLMQLFLVPERLDHKAREMTGVVQNVEVKEVWGKGNVGTNIYEEFRNKILSFKPDIIAFSIVENNYGLAKELFCVAKETAEATVLVGGIFPTVATDIFIEDDNVDLICVGEGEYTILELVNRLDNKDDTMNIPNIISKKDKYSGGMLKYSQYYDWEPLLFQDWDIFDERHLFKPFMGKIWKTGFFEMSRGCPFNCSYCANHIYQRKFKALGKYNRQKPIESVVKEIEYMKKKYSLELVFFNDENLLTMGDKRFNKFCELYNKNVSLPFFIQTRADSLLQKNKIKALSEAGCITIGIGVESGNAEIRKKVLRKHISNSVFERAFNNCQQHNIRTTAYVILGLPFETEANILETALFCKRLKATSVAISIFAPYHGTALYDICVKNGFIEDKYHDNISVNYSSILKMPQITKQKIEELYYKFNDLVYS